MNIQERLDQLFGGYKAEWLRSNIFDLFTEPSYFGEMKDNRPFVLQGGRGTGKTTVLRGLSYQGQYEILNKDIERFDANNFIGIYYRANTNHVRAFGGKGVPEDMWTALFEHYMNLVICWEIVRFLKWHKEQRPDEATLDCRVCKRIAKSLHINEDINTFDDIYDSMEDALIEFQSNLNNVADGEYPKLSMCSVPIQLLTAKLRELPQFADKTVYLLIDEYENFSDSQQESMNTMIKHINDNYTFKIGVREMGWRVKHTHNPLESLNHPADYFMYKIEEKFTNEDPARFEDFAKRICNQRLRLLMQDTMFTKDFTIEQALESLTIEEEAERLHVEKNHLYKRFVDYERANNTVINIHPLYKFTIAYWADVHNENIETEIEDYLENTLAWNNRYDNYKYGMLFKITKARGGVTMPKYYCGWSTFIKLANGNIRYLMGLVHQSYSYMLKEKNEIMSTVSPECQTIAAKNIGWLNLTELEGSCGIGMQLTQLVQSLGTVFKSLARDGEKSAPELVQFDFDGEVSDRTRDVINLGVMNLALVRMPANKLSSTSIKDFQYALHPTFAPYFDFSFRRKRKMSIKDEEFLGFIDTPEDTVTKLLRRRSVKIEDEQTVPTQLTLFDYEDFANE